MREYPGKIRLVIKHYPYKYRHHARIAAEAALAAREQGKFWKMHDIMLKNSPKLDRESLLDYARELGLDMRRFKGDLDNMRHLKLIEQDHALAISLDVYNTPTFLFNGRMVIGNRPYAYMKKVLEEELARAEEK